MNPVFRKNHFLFFIISLFFTNACSEPKNNLNLLINDAYAKIPLVEGQATAVYLVLKNLTNKPLIITKISCEDYITPSFHETKIKKESGMIVMNKLDSLTINPRSELEFKPGGKHIMMMGPNLSNDLLKEINCDLLTFNGTSHSISIPIR